MKGPKYIGWYFYTSGYNWICVEELKIEGYRHKASTIDDKENRIRFEETYGIKEWMHKPSYK